MNTKDLLYDARKEMVLYTVGAYNELLTIIDLTGNGTEYECEIKGNQRFLLKHGIDSSSTTEEKVVRDLLRLSTSIKAVE